MITRISLRRARRRRAGAGAHARGEEVTRARRRAAAPPLPARERRARAISLGWLAGREVGPRSMAMAPLLEVAYRRQLGQSPTPGRMMDI